MSQGRASLSERLADQVVELIRTNKLGPGDPLPPSRELAAQLEVTTPTLREALRRLEATGVIELRHGSGTYIAPGLERSVLASPHRPPISRQSVLELAEARLVLEPGIAAHAATARDDEALARLEVAVGNALQPPRPGVRSATHFHVELAAATGNPLVRETVEALLHVRSGEQAEIRLRYDDREADHSEHQQILAAVRDREPERARALVTEHLARIRDAIRDGATRRTRR